MGERFSENPGSFVEVLEGLPPLLRDAPDQHNPVKLEQGDVVKAAGDGNLSAMLSRNAMRPISPKLLAFVEFLLGTHADASRVYGCSGAMVDTGLALMKEEPDRAYTLALALDGQWHRVGVISLSDETAVAIRSALVDVGASPKTRARDAGIAKRQADQRTLDAQKKAIEQSRLAERKKQWRKEHDAETEARHSAHLGSADRMGLIAK